MSPTRRRLGIVALGLSFLCSSCNSDRTIAPLSAPPSVLTSVITFEDLGNAYFLNGGGQNIGSFYPGIAFGPNVTGLSASRFDGYSSSAFPPHSGDVVIFDPVDSTMVISFANAIQSFGIWYTSFDPLTLEAFDQNNNLLGTITANPNTDGSAGAASFLTLSNPRIKSVSLTSSPGLFTLDDLTIEMTPDLSLVGLLIPMLIVLTLLMSFVALVSLKTPKLRISNYSGGCEQVLFRRFFFGAKRFFRKTIFSERSKGSDTKITNVRSTSGSIWTLMRWSSCLLVFLAIASQSKAQAPAQQYVFAEGANGFAGITVVDAATGSYAAVLQYPAYCGQNGHTLAISPDYRYVYVTGTAGCNYNFPSVWILNYAGGSIVDRIALPAYFSSYVPALGTGASVSDVAVGPGGRFIYVSSDAGDLAEIDPVTKLVTRHLNLNGLTNVT
jgi:hypothetical protein